ncbi:cysteine desulfurase family protein [Alkalibacter saccharofermentans]|uniref:cysteine desulfurase n=1 Tax=Alkalibacter saccharofermentans DSM 14828 TaxID=1120975 RepID=A0A1M4S7A3_9FIRM|nr:cysteine desulfurase family protein [Alkalibacter saccharofermentans]SHE28096.1 cysteine desulfurase [Alkalibacter saccharofermentans DSM 14828]
MKIIYFDNSATTKVDDSAIEIMNRYHRESYGNPSSLHSMGVEAEKAVENSREIIAGRLGVNKNEIFFTSGGSEGNNFLIRGAVEKGRKKGNRIITTKIEHPSVLELFKNYQAMGMDVVFLDVDRKGQIITDQLEEALTQETILVSIMMVNNEVGSIQDMKAVGRLIRKKSRYALYHSDCVQAFGKMDINPTDSNLDMITFSAHKMHGPKGVGGVYIKKGLSINPLIKGGGQEKALRSGTENVPGIAGFGNVAETFSVHEGLEHFNKLKKSFIKRALKDIPDTIVNSPAGENFIANIISISFKDVKSEILLHSLEKQGIFISTGSACSSKKNTASHVLKAMGVEKEYIDGTLRVSFSKHNTLEEVDICLSAIKSGAEKIRRFTRRK